MKGKFNKRAVAASLAATALALLSGCGSSAPPPPPPAAAAGGIGLGGGCVPISSTNMIGFTATNMYLGNIQTGDTSVVGGMIPAGDQIASPGIHGTVMVSAGNVAPPPTTAYGVPMTFQTQRVDGTTMTLSVTSAQTQIPPNTGYYPSGYGNQYTYPYGASGPVNATGYIQVSSMLQNLLVQTALGNFNGNTGIMGPIGSYPTGYPNNYQTNLAQICVSGLGFALERTSPSFANWLYLGNVYFYMSGGVFGAGNQHGLAVYF